MAIKILPFYAEYFKIPFVLPKLDMIAVEELSFGKKNIIFRIILGIMRLSQNAAQQTFIYDKR
jgi:aminopeptidase N